MCYGSIHHFMKPRGYMKHNNNVFENITYKMNHNSYKKNLIIFLNNQPPDPLDSIDLKQREYQSTMNICILD